MFRLRTINARLLFGFGTSITLLMVAGLVGWWGLQRTSVRSSDTIDGLTLRSESTERTITTVMRELVAGLRYLKIAPLFGVLKPINRHNNRAKITNTTAGNLSFLF